MNPQTYVITTRALSPHQIELAQQLYDAGDKTVQPIGDIFTVPRTTIYGHLTTKTAASRPAQGA